MKTDLSTKIVLKFKDFKVRLNVQIHSAATVYWLKRMQLCHFKSVSSVGLFLYTVYIDVVAESSLLVMISASAALYELRHNK